MDPNATLHQLRNLVTEASSPRRSDDTADALATAFEELDHWISAGGFLPDDWQRLS